MIFIANWVKIIFGIFLIGVGCLMFLATKKTGQYIRKAASSNLINYSEITIRMIPVAALVIYFDYSRFPEVFWYAGSFMILTSLVLFLVPRRWHHNYALRCAEMLKPSYVRMMSLFSIALGVLDIYSIT